MAAYVTTKDAAAHFGVCTKTFRRMVAALPAARRPKPVEFRTGLKGADGKPVRAIRRWRVGDLDSAFSAASASTGWDQLVEEKPHVTESRNNRMGRGRGR